MARQKRGSRVLDKARRRLAGIQSINTKLELDGGISAAGYEKEIEALRNKIDLYNRTLSRVDALYNDIQSAERSVSSYSEKVLLGVAVRYGKDSNEYEQAGGVRKQDRRRAASKMTPATV